MLTNFNLRLSLRHSPIVGAYLYRVIFRQLKPKKYHSGGWFSKIAFRFVYVHRGSYIITLRKYLNKGLLIQKHHFNPLHLQNALRKRDLLNIVTPAGHT